MFRRLFFPILLGIAGTAVLMSLGFWQLHRLEWKETILADIDRRVHAEPVDLPANPIEKDDKYLAVKATGTFTGQSIDVLVSRKEQGAGFRVVEAFETAGRRILVDRGFVTDDHRADPRPSPTMEVVGNLHWPQEVDQFTPAPDPQTGMWFARDLPEMAKALGTEPILIVARAPTSDQIEPMPVDNSGIPNDHLGYAIQWFGLAFVWLGMTAYLLWRINRRTF